MSSPEFYVSANLNILIQVPTNKKDEMKRSRPCAHHEIPVDHQLSTLLGKDWQSILNLSNDITTKYTLLHHSYTETAQCFAKINIRCICGIPPTYKASHHGKNGIWFIWQYSYKPYVSS